ncbi:MAG: methyltransferase domain-containing protein [Nocardioides sp.]
MTGLLVDPALGDAPVAAVLAAAYQGARCFVDRRGHAVPLEAARWSGEVDVVDAALLDQCRGPVLDIGCGPGRLVAALTAREVCALGIDVLDEAVRLTRARGAAALCRDVFAPLPAEGLWGTTLLADGSIGIGGDPARLLCRTGQLLAPGGRVVVDLAAYGTGVATRTLRLRTDLLRSGEFPWAFVGAEAIGELASGAGFDVHSRHEYGGRWFAVLTRR